MKAYQHCCRYCAVACKEKENKYFCNCSGMELTEEELDDDMSECPEYYLNTTPLQDREVEE